MTEKYQDLMTFAGMSRVHPDFWMSKPELRQWLKYAKLYDSWNKRATEIIMIPKIIHQIWIGSQMPEELCELSKSWKRKMPEYEHWIWTEKEIELLEFKGKHVYEMAKNPGLKSDVARYAILEEFGGLYADTDFECIKSLEKCLNGSSFIAGHLPAPSSGNVEIANGLIACTKNNKIIKEVNDEISKIKTINEHDNIEIMKATGPYMLTNILNSVILDETVGILPSNYFYAWPNFLKELQGEPKIFLRDYSLCLHYWHCSWMKQRKEKTNLISRIYKKFRRVIKTK